MFSYRLCLTRHTYSGVMRITVCVVVIMFELTGALTYILPTMVRSQVFPPRGLPHRTANYIMGRLFYW